MGNYAFFRGCSSCDSLLLRRSDAAPGAGSVEPEIDAKYCIPLFWLAGFSPDDLVARKFYDEESPDTVLFEYLVPCTATRKFAERARMRRAGMLSLVPVALGDFYGEWVRFVERRYASCVTIETLDIFSMGDVEESGLRLRGALRALQVADRGEPVREASALQWFAGFEDLARERVPGETAENAAQRWRNLLGGTGVLPGSGTLLWPTKPTPAEIAFAANLPETPQHAPGSLAAQDADFAALVRSGVVSDDPRGRLSIALKKLSGELPLGVDAPTRGLRKAISGGGEFLALVRDGVVGLVFAVLGPGFIWASWGPPIYWMGAGIGAALLLAGLWLVRAAWRAQRRFRAVLRA